MQHRSHNLAKPLKSPQTHSPRADYTRRDFLKGGSFATLMAMLGGVELVAQANATEEATQYKTTGAKVKCAVIGLGTWGRELVNTLQRVPEAELAAVCDTYPSSLRRGGNLAPGAAQVDDYRKILDDKEIRAVVVATPTHTHRDIALAALAAGKHVYCEAPLAHTIEDARAIARAAVAANRQIFQPGLQTRADPHRLFLLPFMRSGAIGKSVVARAQWRKKQSWRATSPNPDREKELNWRLDKAISPGLIGELGIHQVDAVSWFFNSRPVAVTGFGSILHWRDGREVPDTIQAVFEYPDGARLLYDATLVNSFEADYEVYCGSDAAVMIRGPKAWMFKEADAPLLGWEVYASKEVFHKETGILLVAGASKVADTGEAPGTRDPYPEGALYYALRTFLINSDQLGSAVEDFLASFDPNDKAALDEFLKGVNRQPAPTAKDGYEATVLALEANEAVLQGSKITLDPSWFELS